jgi:hypothetical protein
MAEAENLREFIPESCEELLDKSSVEPRSAIPELARNKGRREKSKRQYSRFRLITNSTKTIRVI